MKLISSIGVKNLLIPTKLSYFFFSLFLYACKISGEETIPLLNNSTGSCALEDMLAEKLERTRDKDDEQLSEKVLVMQPILRFLQLLCENHNRYLQVNVLHGLGGLDSKKLRPSSFMAS